MKYYRMRILLVAAFAILPLYESSAASIDDILGRTYLEIQPGLGYRLQYEDNIDYNRSGKDRISDWSNIYRPSVDINAFSPRFSLNSHVDLAIAEYINERDFNYVDQNYTLSLGYIPNERLEFSLGAGYMVDTRNDRFEDIGAIDPTDEYVSYKDKTTNFNGGFSYELTPRSTIGLTGGIVQYDSITTDGSNFYSLIGSYTYSLSPRTNLLFNMAYFYYKFDGNNDTLDTLDPDEIYYNYSNYSYEMKNYSMTGGFEYMFENGGKLLAQFGLRYSKTDSTQTDNDTATEDVNISGNGNGWVGVIEYQKRFNDFLFGFEAHNDVTVSPEGANYESTSFIARTDYRITQRLNAKLDLRVVRAYADSSNDEFVGGNRDTNTYIVRPSLSYKAYRWLQTSIGYQFRYTHDKQNDSVRHANLFYIDLNFIPLRNLVLR
jgi:hypothetical protein